MKRQALLLAGLLALLAVLPAFTVFPVQIRVGSSDPATCSTSGVPGEINLFWNTGVPALKYCSATNTWTAIGTSGMTRSFMAAATQQSNASLAGSCASAALCPTPNVVNNGNGISFGVASFSSAGATTNELQWHWIIPSGFTNTTLTAQVTWRSGVADATKNVVWQAQTACVAPGSADNATFGSAATVTSANNASANVMISATITLGAQAVACATAGNEMYFRLFRTTGGSDTLAAGTADLESVYVSGT